MGTTTYIINGNATPLIQHVKDFEIYQRDSLIKRKDDEIKALKKVTEHISEQLSKQTVKDMLMDNEPLEKIMKYSHLPEDIIVNLAASMGVTVNR